MTVVAKNKPQQNSGGSTQVTYNGHPLYYYADDVSPGDTLGQAVGDVWYVTDAQGNQME